MKTKTLLMFIALSYSFLATAQEENFDNEYSETKKKANPMHANGFNYISFGAEVGPTLNRAGQSYPIHFALPTKVYLGRQKKGRFIIRTGLHYFPSNFPDRFVDVKRSYTTIIPLAVGYRKNIQKWYIEGSLGAALNTSTTVFKDSSIENWTVTYREINYGLEVGKQIGDFDVGVAVYNTGPIPFHILYAGVKTSYRIRW
ncbi:hypothetical protein MMU07_07175 [Aquiflexum sp. LQ15W]|uniref:hypothetical protein n=1 Tax=Cognataquiflexum nitidum TaxID=2922272 RepID=UPI001F1430B7|nr:hypothetical protein [Cognataquiflexum nitidum]MCH6199352.1 hypothetical protein [Cognataquiflexum nitidum]